MKPQPLIRTPGIFGLVVIALCAELGYAVLNISTMPVYLRSDRHFGEGSIGIFLAAFLVSEAVAKGSLGQLADRWGARRFMIAGPLISLVACISTILLPKTGGSPGEIAALLGFRLLDGIAAGIFWPAAFAYAGRLAADDRRQEAMSLLNLCYLLGLGLALPIGGLADDLTHSHAAGLVMAIGFFALAGVLSMVLVGQSAGSAPEATKPQAAADSILWPVVLTLVTFVGVGFPMAILKLFAQDAFHLSESQFGALVIPGALLMAGLSVPCARFGAKIGTGLSVQLGLGLCAAGTLVIGLGALLPWLRHPALVALAAIPVGFGFTLALPAWMASVGEINPDRQAANIGAVMAAQGVGAIIGTPLGALLYEKGQHLGLGVTFGYFSPFLGCGVCILFGFLLSLVVLARRRH